MFSCASSLPLFADTMLHLLEVDNFTLDYILTFKVWKSIEICQNEGLGSSIFRKKSEITTMYLSGKISFKKVNL